MQRSCSIPMRTTISCHPSKRQEEGLEGNGQLRVSPRSSPIVLITTSDAGLVLGYPTFPKPGNARDLTQAVCDFAQAAVLPYLTSVSSSFFVCSKPSSSAARRVASVARASALSKSAVTSRSFVSSTPRILFSELAVSDASANSARNWSCARPFEDRDAASCLA
jgi:hypothetical protein